ncbi:hypothetical protein GOODEAATRI_012863 [Goodea atripinnis]|uniref:Cullin family profile domain-containing protein n=1 Tax=Goodea atripinnis TaxID=208336 RepID=A0ABV0PY95_9TELE
MLDASLNIVKSECVSSVSPQLMECCVNALVTSFKETILAECPGMIKRNETETELHLMFSLMDKVPSGIEPMLKDLEEHIVNAGLADMVAAAETITTLLVLKYVQNKDVFMRYHKAHLTRRLILDISADSEIEENMVEWLRVVTCALQPLHALVQSTHLEGRVV